MPDANLNDYHFSVETLGQTLLFRALPCTELNVLGKSCHVEITNKGFIVYPRAKKNEYPGDTIHIESRYHGRQGDVHHKPLLIKIGWNDKAPKIVEVTDTCTIEKQLSLNATDLTIRVNDIVYTTAKVSTKETRLHASHDTLCEYEASVIDNSTLVKIAKKIKEGQKVKEAVTIKNLQEKINHLKSELNEKRSSLQKSQDSLRQANGSLDVLREERAGLQKHLKLGEKKILADDVEIKALELQGEDLTKNGQKLVNEVIDWGNLKSILRIPMPTTTSSALKSMQVTIKNATNTPGNSTEFLSDSPENQHFMGDGTGQKSDIKIE